jgi:phosphatidylglycerophosphatase A
MYVGRPVLRPTLGFLLRRPAHFIALGFGAGLIPVAPGTFGTLLALPLFWWFNARLSPGQFLVLLALLYLLGIWCCQQAGKNLGIEDHKAIVWDETLAFLIVLFFTPLNPLWQAFAFLLFRLFDIFKPGPIRAIERRFRGGFGVMIDDLAAAFATLLCFALLRIVLPHGGPFG